MTHLLDFPNELLEQVVLNLESDADIAAVVRTNRRLCRLSTDHVYRHNDNHAGKSAAVWAAIQGRVETLLRAEAAGVAIRQLGILYEAVEWGHGDVVDLLLDASPEGSQLMHLCSKDGELLLRCALICDNVHIVMQLLPSWRFRCQHVRTTAFGVLLLPHRLRETETVPLLSCSSTTEPMSTMPTALVSNSRTPAPLCLAAAGGHVSVVRLLVKRGADICRWSERCELTPLTAAVENGWFTTAQLLLDKGASCKGTTRMGLTALHLAAERGSLLTAELLLKNGADPKAVCSGNGQTALHMAANTASGYAPVNLLLSQAGVDVNHRDALGRTPLFYAAGHGDVMTVKKLLAHDAAADIKDLFGATAIVAAVTNGHLESASVLLGAYPDAIGLQDASYNTLFSLAAERGNEELERLLRDLVCDRIDVEQSGRNVTEAAVLCV
ncbi:Ankyrin repeat-containing domain protein [Tolypocladium paradoxum]|uniref:Ankyrin repeat-containing domain protein n=1 Tax=Tolypocladium paradoxum TaxID=94208 RepID=A0A2S4KUM3_9HYPO|nr:Ankyrin repeat-containing domain protein [Tolypocladium paradoxum]